MITMINMELLVKVAISLAAALVMSFAATPIVKTLATRVGAMDVPRDGRRMHDHPIPRMGGLAIFLGFILSVLLFADITPQVQGILLGSVVIVIVGVIDDMISLKWWLKLLGQFVAAGVAVAHGVVITILSNPNVLSQSLYLDLGWLAIPITLLWIVGITNSVNLIDGLDGLAVGVSGISSVTMLVIALLVSEGNVAVIMAALAGACLGFIPFNFNPAKIFAGDTGALLLGYVLSTMSVVGLFKVYAIISFVLPFLVLALPFFDTTFAFVRRILKGQNPMKPDRGHVHHKLIDMGLSQKQAVAVLYCVSIVFGLAAVLLTTSGVVKALIFIAAFVVAGVVAGVVYKSTRKEAMRRKILHDTEHGALKAEGEKIRVLSVFGTRPEAVKMAPLVLELRRSPRFESLCCVTAQHREMLDSVLDIFELKPDYDLDIMQSGQTLTDVTVRAVTGLEKVLTEVKPDIVLVHGDTSTTFSAALAAFYSRVSVGHVEAGLRTGDKFSPYPEEMNRRLTADIADLSFCPTAGNRLNLLREGVHTGLFVTGNTVIDAMKYTVREGFVSSVPEIRDLPEGKRIITLTCHRRENYGEPMENIFRAVRRIAEARDDVVFVYPVHPAPTVRDTAERLLSGVENIRLIEPLDVVEMHNLMARSYMVMTDSGGLQEEAPSMGKPVLVLRKETERPEAVNAGTVKVAGVEEEPIVSLALELLDNEKSYKAMAEAVNPYGDGRACERIARAILYAFGRLDERPEDLPDVPPYAAKKKRA